MDQAAVHVIAGVLRNHLAAEASLPGGAHSLTQENSWVTLLGGPCVCLHTSWEPGVLRAAGVQ